AFLLYVARSPRALSLFPSTPLFRSGREVVDRRAGAAQLLLEQAVEGRVRAIPAGIGEALGEIGPGCLREEASGPFAHGLFDFGRSEEHTSELQSLTNLVCRLLLEKK